MSLFKFNAQSKSYLFPIIKIIICVCLIPIIIFRNKVFQITNQNWSVLLTIVALIVICAVILCLYIAIAEMIATYENRRAEKQCSMVVDKTKCRACALNEIFTMVRENDIIEIVVYTESKRLCVGASSDFEHASGIFFDKKYYIDDWETSFFEEFQKRFYAYANNSVVYVYTIDGVKEIR